MDMLGRSIPGESDRDVHKETSGNSCLYFDRTDVVEHAHVWTRKPQLRYVYTYLDATYLAGYVHVHTWM
jgi:hypothetical protein